MLWNLRSEKTRALLETAALGWLLGAVGLGFIAWVSVLTGIFGAALLYGGALLVGAELDGSSRNFAFVVLAALSAPFWLGIWVDTFHKAPRPDPLDD